MVTTEAPPSALPQTQPRTAASAVLAWLATSHWTEAAYFALPDTNYIVELSEGRLLVHDMPNLEHQEIVKNLAFAMETIIRQWGVGRMFFAPMPIRLWEGKIRDPDITFYAAGSEDRYHVQYADPPDLVIEVLSPRTRRLDRVEKAAEYAAAGGVHVAPAVRAGGHRDLGGLARPRGASRGAAPGRSGVELS